MDVNTVRLRVEIARRLLDLALPVGGVAAGIARPLALTPGEPLRAIPGVFALAMFLVLLPLA